MLSALFRRYRRRPPISLGPYPVFLRGRSSPGELSDTIRRRGSWNDRFAHWEKAATGTEEATIERARSNVLSAIAYNQWLSSSGVVVASQSSYQNNTNVRTEADIDLRVVHPVVQIEYANDVHRESAFSMLRYDSHALTSEQIIARLRAELRSDLSSRFGAANVVVGKKAIRIKGITGSRAEVDVVPSMRHHYVHVERRSPTSRLRASRSCPPRADGRSISRCSTRPTGWRSELAQRIDLRRWCAP